MATQSKPTPTKRYQSRLKKLEKEDYLIRATRALFTPAYYNKVPKAVQNFHDKRLGEIPKEIKRIKEIINGKDKRVTKTKIGKTTLTGKRNIVDEASYKLMKKRANANN
tara:strand:+ start:122 stop:448 length:327 start_codon:yes stop_codon:yes gene_type:complete